ncbi:MAG: hypothetical protein ACKV2V_29285 [Blastocatellia bacterium]
MAVIKMQGLNKTTLRLAAILAALCLSCDGGRTLAQELDRVPPALREMTPEEEGNRQRVQTLLQQARAAISVGRGVSPDQITSFSVSGRYVRPTKYVQVSWKDKVEEKVKNLDGKIELIFQTPDKFRKKESGESLTDWPYTYREIANGPDAWRDPPAPLPTRSRGRVVDVDDVAEANRLRALAIQQEFTWYMMAFLLRPGTAFPVEIMYAGETELSGARAEALLVTGQNDTRFLLLLDRETHRPLMIGVTFIDSLNTPVLFQRVPYSRQANREMMILARREAEARRKKPRRVDMRIIFSDHRQVDGLLLPYRLTTTLNGEIFEEMEIREYKFNRGFKAKDFEKGRP